MGRFKQPYNGKGSLKALQELVNKYPSFFENEIRKSFPELQNIEWVSPLCNDDMAEYRDQDFLNRLGLNHLSLISFWPNGGPQWDALGRIERAGGPDVILVEAKANLSELRTVGTKATSSSSLNLINKSLKEVKDYLGVASAPNWAELYYQYCNRLAHLYYLRKHKVNAYLVFVYFIGDRSVNGPETKEEWLVEIKKMKDKLGLPEEIKLSRYITDLFIPIERNLPSE
jgi:hypothetical protein